MRFPLSRRHALALGLALVVGGAGAAGVAALLRASDHQDTPDVELNAKSDMTDVYVFPSPTAGRIVLAMDTRAFLTPAQTQDPTLASFDPNLLYQFKVDNNGDAKEDKVIQVTFTGTGGNQQVQVRGPVAPPVQGAMLNQLANTGIAVNGALNTTLGSPNNIQVFAGPRDDPFFLDLEAVFCVLPDRKPVTGPLASACALPPNPTAPFFFRDAGQAVDYVQGFNVLSIVIELPSAMLENGAPGKLGIWGTISR
jgi:hypothetical protein